MLERTSTYAVKPKGSIFWGATVMFFGGLILSFIPFFGGLIAGIVGGKIAGSVRNAIIAAIIPAIVVAGVAALVAIFHPVIALFVAIGAFFIGLLHIIGVLVGAVIGGIL